MLELIILINTSNNTRRPVEQFKMFSKQHMRMDGWHWNGRTVNTRQGAGKDWFDLGHMKSGMNLERR